MYFTIDHVICSWIHFNLLCFTSCFDGPRLYL